MGGRPMTQRELQIRPADAPCEDLAKILESDGCVVLKDFASKSQVEALNNELRPFIDATMQSKSDFGGFKTTRTGALIARSPRCRELAIDPRILDLVETFLAPYANTFQLHLTQVIRVLPGETAQFGQLLAGRHKCDCSYTVDDPVLQAVPSGRAGIRGGHLGQAGRYRHH